MEMNRGVYHGEGGPGGHGPSKLSGSKPKKNDQNKLKNKTKKHTPKCFYLSLKTLTLDFP